MIPSTFKNPICVALDVDTQDRALNLVQELKDVVGGFKVGPRLCLRYGSSLIEKIAQDAPVFVDNKHFDIPSTMVAAVQASFEAGATLVTIHSLAGQKALSELAELEKRWSQKRFVKVLAVTILTSWDDREFSPNFKQQSILAHVQELSKEVLKAGLSGLVCSPQELELLQGRGHYLVTPGIRFANNATQDQKRVLSPSEAIAAGANLLVVGRPIIEAQNPRTAAAEFVKSTYEKFENSP